MNVIIRTNGSIEQVMPNNGTDFQLNELQSIVGGWIEIVTLDDGHHMVLNSDGKVLRLPQNSKATYIYHNHTRCNDVIVGDVLICDNDKIQ